MERFFLPKLHDAGVLFDKASDDVVKNAQKRSQVDNGGFRSLLECMCSDSSHSALSPKELKHEVKTFLIAGHETTATLCTWAIYCMTKYPSIIQQRLYIEVMEAHGSQDKMNVDSCDKMEYMDCFLKEVLRLYPPVGITLRLTSKNTNILGDKIPANTKIVLPSYLLHRHPQYWTDPLEFKPERWSKTAEKDPKFHHFAYFPFSAGSRSCIGQRFSMYEAKIILAMLIREFEFTLSPSLEGKKLRVSSFVTIRSNPPISIRANSRCG
jgi:cytochrome P450